VKDVAALASDELIIDAGVRALLAPRSVALIGVSDDPGKMAGGPARALSNSAFAGAIYPVNPKRETVGGYRAFPTIDAIEGDPDVALIVTPRHAVVEAVEACARKGVKAVVIISSGFGEVGPEGIALQERLLEVARAGGVRVVGPNCTGYYSRKADLPLGTSAAFGTGRYAPGSIAFVTQSGAIGTALLTLAHERGLGASLWFSTGNEMDLTVADFMSAAVADPNTSSIVLYLETIRNVPAFTRAARAALARGKPVIVLKVGRTELGAEKAQAHTGAMIGSDDAYQGLFRQNGVIRVDSIDHLLPVASLFGSDRAWGRGRIGVISVSGGLAAYMADLLSDQGLELAELTAGTNARLAEISDLAAPGNPFDPAGMVTSDPTIMTRAVAAFLEDPNVDVMTVILPFGIHILRVVPPVVLEAARASRKMVCFVRWMPRDYGREVTEAMTEADVPVFEGIDECVAALAARARYERERSALIEALADKPAIAALPAPELDGDEPLLETEARALLARYGVASPKERVAVSANEAIHAATAIGYPVAMKILSRDIAHKTEAGGVRLGLLGEEAVAAAYEQMMTDVGRHAPDAVVDGVLVQQMAGDGIDVILGAKHEPGIGPVVMVGIGGVLAEAISKVSVRPAPLSARDAAEMIEEASLGSLLASARRGRPSDRPALEQSILSFSRLVCDHGDHIAELDVNPLRVLLAGDGVIALDALVVRATSARTDG
jgi:acyl-CoA synthetase (NDP forming)